MPFEWLDEHQRGRAKDPDYAERTLAAYALGIKGNGSLAGVIVATDAGCCEAARRLPPGEVYEPGEAPRVPLAGCDRPGRCRCVYRPVMKYQR